MLEKVRHWAFYLLRRFEQLAKTDLVYLMKGSFWLTASQIISSLAALITAIAFANWVSPEVYGSYKYFLSVATILSIPTLSGIDTATIRAVAQGKEATVFAAFLSKLRWGSLSTLASLALALYYGLIVHNPALTLGFVLFAVTVSPMEAFRLYQAYLIGKKRFRTVSIALVISKIISVGLLLGTMYLTQNLFLIIAAYLLPTVGTRAVYWLATLKTVNKNSERDPNILSHGKQFTLNNIAISISDQLDQILLFHLLGPIQVAIFQFATAPTEQIKGFLKNIPAVAMPKFSNRSTAEIRQTINHRLWRYAVVLVVVTLIYLPLAPLVFRYVFPRYLSAVFMSQIFALSLVGVCLLSVITTIFESQALIKTLYKFRVFNAVSQTLITIILIPLYGIWGAIFARMIYRYLSLIVAWMMLQKAEAEQ